MASTSACLFKEGDAEMVTPEELQQRKIDEINSAGMNMDVYRITYADVQPIFQAKCVNCHGAGMQGGSRRYDSYAAILTQVNLGNPQSTVFYDAIRTGAPNNQTRARMPKAPNAELSSLEQQMILDWIIQGALEN